MSYLKDINIFGYIDAKGDVAKVSKIAFTNQAVKNLLNLRIGDSRLSDDKFKNNIDAYKFSTDYAKNIKTNVSIISRVKNKLKQIVDLTVTPTQATKTVTFVVSYTISDSISKNLQSSTFKFTIDK
jgi:hypothetical protein